MLNGMFAPHALPLMLVALWVCGMVVLGVLSCLASRKSIRVPFGVSVHLIGVVAALVWTYLFAAPVLQQGRH